MAQPVRSINAGQMRLDLANRPRGWAYFIAVGDARPPPRSCGGYGCPRRPISSISATDDQERAQRACRRSAASRYGSPRHQLNVRHLQRRADTRWRWGRYDTETCFSFQPGGDIRRSHASHIGIDSPNEIAALTPSSGSHLFACRSSSAVDSTLKADGYHLQAGAISSSGFAHGPKRRSAKGSPPAPQHPAPVSPTETMSKKPVPQTRQPDSNTADWSWP